MNLTHKIEVFGNEVPGELEIHKFDKTFKRLLHDYGSKIGMTKEISPSGQDIYRCSLTGELVTRNVAFEVLTYLSLYLDPEKN